jgi:hypothetical protein
MSMRFGVGGGIGIGPTIVSAPIEELLSHVKTIPMSKTVPAQTWCYMASEKCTPGKIWEVLRVAVGVASDPSNAPAGSVYAYVGVQVPQDSNNPPAASDMIAVNGTIPNTSYPLRYSVLLQEGERVIVAMKGVPVATEMGGVVAVIEHDKSALLRSLAAQPPPRLKASGRAADEPQTP